MLRTWLCRKLRARRRMAISSPEGPVRSISMVSSVLTGESRLALRRAEGREVVPAGQRRRGLAHRVHVEGVADAPGEPRLQRQRRAPADDAIYVVPADRAEAGVEIVRHPLGRQHGDRGGPQMVVHRLGQPEGLPVAAEVGMRHLAQRVHAGIGAARAGHRRRLAEPRQRRLERRLHRRPGRLPLPADERPAMVFERQLEARHGACLPQRPCRRQGVASIAGPWVGPHIGRREARESGGWASATWLTTCWAGIDRARRGMGRDFRAGAADRRHRAFRVRARLCSSPRWSRACCTAAACAC